MYIIPSKDSDLKNLSLKAPNRVALGIKSELMI